MVPETCFTNKKASCKIIQVICFLVDRYRSGNMDKDIDLNGEQQRHRCRDGYRYKVS